MKDIQTESALVSMRKGMIEFCTMLIINKGKVYTSDILKQLKSADLLVVEGTLYPLLSRLKSEALVDYAWEESKSGPPRKYYTLTKAGEESLSQSKEAWKELTNSINILLK
jgi:PadR family transcriptional regulator PadR